MMKMVAASLTAAVAAGAALVGLQAPAQAQQGSGVLELVVYGNDPCPRSTDAEVVVCVRRPETERYRIPEAYRGAGPRQSREAWVSRARTLETVSDTGTFSCSAVGPAGYTGCLDQLIRQNTGQRREEVDASAPPQ